MNPADKSDVQAMFGRIARRYNLMNRLMTFGQDQRWRRFLVKQAQIPAQGRILDIASGTGDIAFEIRRQYPDAEVIAADFALPMMQVGQTRHFGTEVDWLGANALYLPLPTANVDAVTSGFLLRNVPDVEQALTEQFRVLKPGGWMVTLDTTPPQQSLMKPFINFHLKFVIPFVGKLITGDSTAYRYLPASTLAFKTADELADLLRQTGFENVGYRRFMLGTIAVHWGQRPES